MSLTENEVDLVNQALSKFGSFTIDYSDTTGTGNSGMLGNVAVKSEIHYEQTRNSLLRQAYWNFAAERLSLVSSWETATAYTTDQYVWVSSVLYKCNTAHTSTTWTSNYVYDGDDLVYDGTDLVVDDTVTFYWTMIFDRCPFEYDYRYSVPSDFLRMKPNYFKDEWIDARVEGAYILTDESELDIKYIKRVTDPDDFDPLYTEVLICDLALKLSTSLAGAGYPVLANKKDIKEERKEAMRRARAVCASENKRLNYNQWINARYGTGIV